MNTTTTTTNDALDSFKKLAAAIAANIRPSGFNDQIDNYAIEVAAKAFEQMFKKRFYLFGEDVSSMYWNMQADDNFEGFLENLRTNENGYAWSIYQSNGCDPVEILQEADGWSGHTEITEQEYNQLLNIVTKQ